MAVSVEARWRRSIRSWRSRWTGVRPGSVRLTSVTTSVGTSQAPDAARASIAASSASQACSTLATPATAERRTDSPSWAWLMTRRPSSRRGRRRWRAARPRQLRGAVDHPARLVAGRREHRRLRGDDLDHVGARRDDPSRGRPPARPGRPPRGRTPRRGRPPRRRPCPAATIRGPGTSPAAIASRRTTSRLRIEPAPRAVVTPARSAMRRRAARPRQRSRRRSGGRSPGASPRSDRTCSGRGRR